MSSPITTNDQIHDLETMLGLWWPVDTFDGDESKRWKVSWSVRKQRFTAKCGDPQAPVLLPQRSHNEARKNWFAVFAVRKGLV